MLKNISRESGNTDKWVAIGIIVMLTYSAILLLQAFIQGLDIGPWIWERHQNLFSWYSRPLFIIPACYYAYRHKLWYTAGFMTLLFASLFWFSAPAQVSPQIAGYLEWEKQFFLTTDSYVPLVSLLLAVSIFLIGLFYAFYKRSIWYGLLLINIGTILKIVISIGFGGESGMASIVPSLSSIIFIDIIALFLWWRMSHKN